MKEVSEYSIATIVAVDEFFKIDKLTGLYHFTMYIGLNKQPLLFVDLDYKKVDSYHSLILTEIEENGYCYCNTTVGQLDTWEKDIYMN